MRVVLLTGRAGSKSIRDKNLHPVLGRPLAFYPMWAATQATLVDRCYLSTDSPGLASLARTMGIDVIDRPPELSDDTAELVDTILHALTILEAPDLLVTMHCNVGYHRPGLVDHCIQTLEADPDADSCVTGYVDRAVHPFRTRRIAADGLLQQWLEVPPGTSSNRQALDPCFILDGAVRAMRVALCFPPAGAPPFAYLGRHIIPLENGRGGDVHGLEDVALAEGLLRSDGWEAGVPGSPADGAPRT